MKIGKAYKFCENWGEIYKLCGNKGEYATRIIDLGRWTPLIERARRGLHNARCGHTCARDYTAYPQDSQPHDLSSLRIHFNI